MPSRLLIGQLENLNRWRQLSPFHRGSLRAASPPNYLGQQFAESPRFVRTARGRNEVHSRAFPQELAIERLVCEISEEDQVDFRTIVE